ncbi:MAG: BTAD domain-containing putative transcriptional regulator [Longimicrobiales bacterium]
MIRFRALGGLDLRDDQGNELRSLLAQPKRVALLTYLALEATNGFCRRDRLFALFWPEFDADRARKALRQALHFLRRTLGTDVLVSRGDEEIRLAAGLIWCDAVAFREAANQGRAQEAFDLYRGDLLPGFFVADASHDFEQWLDDERTRLRRAAAAAAWTLVEIANRSGNTLEAARLGRDALRLAPDDETGVRRLIGLLDGAGDRAGALRTYDGFAQRLRDEFDLEPAAETRLLMESVRARNAANVRAISAIAPTPADVPSLDVVDSATTPRVVTARAASKRRNVWAVAIAIVAAAVFGVATLLSRITTGSVPLLAVGWIENQAGPGSAETARLLPGLLATDLARVQGLAGVSDARLYEVLGQLGANPENAQVITDAARRAGADELLQGVLYLRRDTFRLDLRRVDLRSGVVRESYTAEGADAFDLTDRATAIIARDFSLDAPNTVPAAGSTRSLAARRLYEEGLRAYYRSNLTGANALFAAALSEDSTFAMAALYAGGSRAYDDSARAYYAQAIRFSERAPERDRLLIKLSTNYGDHRVALATAETLATRFPSVPGGHLALANLNYPTGNFLRVIPLARRVLVTDSLSLMGNAPMCRACEAYSLIVDAYLGADSLQAAERTAREWLRRQPSSSQAWSALSAILTIGGQPGPARAAFHEAEKRQPNPMAPYILAQMAIQVDDFAEADRLLRARLQFDARDPDALWYLVISLRHQGRIREALALAERVRESAASSDFKYKIPKALILFELGRYREAAAQFDSVAHFDAPSGPMANRGLNARHVSWNHTHTATALAAAGDTTALHSLTDSIAAIAHFSSYGRDWRLPDHLRGLAWLPRGQPERAVQSFRAAIYSPTVGYTRTNLELARALLALNRPGEAVSILQPALRGPIEASNYYVTRTELHELLARSFERAQQPDSAAVHYRRVIAAWSQGDPLFRARADSARQRLRAIAR